MRTRSLDSVSKAGAGEDAGVHAGRIGRARAEMRMKAEEAQDAQVVFLDPPPRLADEAHALRGNIGKAADIIVHLAVQPSRQRVDGEVAPLGVGLPVAPEYHARLASERLDIFAQRRDLDRMMIDDGRDGAVLDAGRHGLAARSLHAPHHFLRQRGRRHIDLGDRKPQQRVAHGAADHACLLTVAVEQRKQARHGAFFQPRRVERGGDGRRHP